MLRLWLVLISVYNGLCDFCSNHFGYSLRDGWATHGDNFEFCAKRHKILMRAVEAFKFNTKLDNFALRHCSYEDAIEAVLEDDRVSLMGVTTDKAFFAVLPRGVDVYDSREASFFINAQFDKAEELITMSLNNFFKLGRIAQKRAEESSRILLLSNTSRCGSTLLTAMLEALDGTVTMSEPDFLTHVSTFLGRGVDIPAADILRAGFALQCKQSVSRPPTRLFILKSMGYSAGLIPLVAKTCPGVSHAFMYRSPDKNIASIISTAGLVPFKDNFAMMANLLTLEGCKHEAAARELAREILNDYTLVNFSSYLWALMMLCFKESRDRLDISIHPLSYEELLEDPAGTISRLLDHCGYNDKTHIDRCLEAMSRDSQSKSAISRDKIRKHKKAGFTDGEVGIINSIFRRLGLPPMDKYLELVLLQSRNK